MKNYLLRTTTNHLKRCYYLLLIDWVRKTERPFYIMSDEHKMTKQDKLVLTITLAAIFFGVFGLGLVGLIFNLSS